MRVGLFDHFGWAIAVTADGQDVVDRRRVALIESGISEAPIHYDRGVSSDAAMARTLAKARASIARATNGAFDQLPSGVTGVALRVWPDDFPVDLATQRRPPYEARADAVMYRQVIAEVAEARGWAVHLYDAKQVLTAFDAAFLDAPKKTLGSPWAKDHRVAYAAAMLS